MKAIKNLLFLVALTPIITSSKLFFGAISAKTMYFSTLVVFAGIFFVYFLIKDSNLKESAISFLKRILKNKIFILFSSFVFISLISTIFAFDSHIAFWGDIERGAGFVNLLMVYTFSVLTLLIFKKEDWLTFLKITLFSTLVLILKQFIDLSGGIERSGSFIGNPAFFAGYLLFSITSSVVVFINTIKKSPWRIFSLLIGILSTISLLLTETRSAVLGLFVGVLFLSLYFIFKENDIKIKKYSLKKISKVFLVTLIFMSVLFGLTIQGNFWKKIPGVSRIADISLGDNTTSSRITSWQSSLKTVSFNNQTKEFFIGWGLENSGFALSKYFNPKQYKYDNTFFDRSHNKFLDVLVMSGVFSLLIYLLIWIFVLRYLYKKDFSFENAALILFFSSFFVHLFFVFDQTPQDIVLFFLIGFVIYKGVFDVEQAGQSKIDDKIILSFIILIILSNAVFFIRGTATSFFQMREYVSLVDDFNEENFDKIKNVLTPFTPAQYNIRKHFIEKTSEFYGKEGLGFDRENLIKNAFNESIKMGEDYLIKKPNDFRFFSYLAAAYNKKFEIENNYDDLKTSEVYMRKAIQFAPERQELNNNLVFNLINQERLEEALDLANKNVLRDEELAIPYFYRGIVYYELGSKNFSKSLDDFEKFFELNTAGFKENSVLSTKVYENFLKYFYDKRDKESFIRVSQRLISNEHAMSKLLPDLISLVERGIWPTVVFK